MARMPANLPDTSLSDDPTSLSFNDSSMLSHLNDDLTSHNISTASSSNPLSTPSQTNSFSHHSRIGLNGRTASGDVSVGPPSRLNTRYLSEDDSTYVVPGIAATPKRPTRKATGEGENTPIAPGREKSKRSGATMTLREHEQAAEEREKQLFALKMHVHFLEERLQNHQTGDQEIMIKQNVELKVMTQTQEMELKKMKKAMREHEKVTSAFQQQIAGLEDDLAQAHEENELLRDTREGSRTHLLDANAALREEKDELERMLKETNEEMVSLQTKLDMRSSRASSVASSRIQELEERIDQLEQDGEHWRREADSAIAALDAREEELDQERDERRRLELVVERLELANERAHVERSESRAEMLDEREGREALEDANNNLRDRLAAQEIKNQTDIDRYEEHIEALESELAELSERCERVDKTNMMRTEELAVAQNEIDELSEALANSQAENEELRAQNQSENQRLVEEQEEIIRELDAKTQDVDQLENELAFSNKEVERLGQDNFTLEEDLDRLRQEAERMARDHDAETRSILNQSQMESEMSSVLKTKLSDTKRELLATQDALNDLEVKYKNLLDREDDLKRRARDAVEARDSEHAARVKAEKEMRALGDQLLEAEDEMKALRRDLGETERSLNREIEDKTRSLEELQSLLSSTRSRLEQRETDIQAVESALHALDSEKRKIGESATTDKFSLELEVDRLRRDLSRCEDDLHRARDDLKEKEKLRREKEAALDKLHDENRDLTTQLSGQSQIRVNLTEKLTAAQAAAKQAESDLQAAKARVAELEQKLNKDQRSMLASESQYRDQLSERNTLLLTIYQYLDKILGVDKTPKKGSALETKPFTNFAVFHDNLISRLKAVSQIQSDFEKRVKDAETRFVDKLTDLKKQLDNRWKQIDRFESSVKNLTEMRNTWRRKYNLKEGELEQAKSANSELSSQLTLLRRAPAAADAPAEIRALTARANQAERRANVAQNQLASLEERLAAQNDRNGSAEIKWEARIKEYERLLKEANEKFKRERQGAKERVNELEATIKSLQKQIDLTNKRAQQIHDVAEASGKRESMGGGGR
ncbi:hypothetical protein DL93DRAFT_2085258 [Clavulina sp. PMI_390]|nr:hypothetical protein DL93DRAFT_2085258 [Clavulina sp. PMI_390]